MPPFGHFLLHVRYTQPSTLSGAGAAPYPPGTRVGVVQGVINTLLPSGDNVTSAGNESVSRNRMMPGPQAQHVRQAAAGEGNRPPDAFEPGGVRQRSE
jgi:hypothetical protein